mgnify:FL=1
MATANGSSATTGLYKSELRVLTHLLERGLGDFDEKLMILCEAYVAKHSQLRDGLAALRRKRAAEQNTQDPILVKIRGVFDRPWDTTLGTAVFFLTTAFILLSILAMTISTVPRFNPDLTPSLAPTWLAIEALVTVYFTAEFILRLVSSEDKINFFKRITTLADALATVPFYVGLLSGQDVSVLRVLRLFRVFAFFRRFPSVDALFQAVWDSLRVLGAPLIFLATCLIVFSTVLFYAERGTYDPVTQRFLLRDCDCEASAAFYFGERDCPRRESKFFSVPHTLWWAVVTMTTVGYGDLVPTCPYGKVVAGFSMVAGVIFMSMPIAVVGNYYTRSVNRSDEIQRQIALKAAEERAEAELAAQGGGKGEGDTLSMVEASSGSTEAPSQRLLRFLAERLPVGTLSLRGDASPYASMLLDLYLGTMHRRPDAVTPVVSFELIQAVGGALSSHAGGTQLLSGSRRISLNRSMPLVIGCSSPGVADPDIVLPAYDANGVPYRISQRHAVLVLPPLFADGSVPVMIRPLRGAVIHVDGRRVPEGGQPLAPGCNIDFHPTDPARPLTYRLGVTHPFALDI